jgi:hypothetical protein
MGSDVYKDVHILQENGISESSEVEYLQKITIEIRDSDNHVHLTVFTVSIRSCLMLGLPFMIHVLLARFGGEDAESCNQSITPRI